jgi:hypothetical protein
MCLYLSTDLMLGRSDQEPGLACWGDSRSDSNATSHEAHSARCGYRRCQAYGPGTPICPVLIRMRSTVQVWLGPPTSQSCSRCSCRLQIIINTNAHPEGGPARRSSGTAGPGRPGRVLRLRLVNSDTLFSSLCDESKVSHPQIRSKAESAEAKGYMFSLYVQA